MIQFKEVPKYEENERGDFLDFYFCTAFTGFTKNEFSCKFGNANWVDDFLKSLFLWKKIVIHRLEEFQVLRLWSWLDQYREIRPEKWKRKVLGLAVANIFWKTKIIIIE